MPAMLVMTKKMIFMKDWYVQYIEWTSIYSCEHILYFCSDVNNIEIICSKIRFLRKLQALCIVNFFTVPIANAYIKNTSFRKLHRILTFWGYLCILLLNIGHYLCIPLFNYYAEVTHIQMPIELSLKVIIKKILLFYKMLSIYWTPIADTLVTFSTKREASCIWKKILVTLIR